MLMPCIVSAVFVVSVVAVCFAKPNAGRIFLGEYLLTQEFDVTFLDMLCKWRARIASR